MLFSGIMLFSISLLLPKLPLDIPINEKKKISDLKGRGELELVSTNFNVLRDQRESTSSRDGLNLANF